MNEITVCETTFVEKIYEGQRVVTFADIDRIHQRPEGTAKRNFNANKEHFIEGEDYYIVKPADVQKYEIRTLEIPNRGLTLLTESGYLMVTKALTDDLAWRVQRELVNTYFRAQQFVKLSVAHMTALQNEVNSLKAQLNDVKAIAEYNAQAISRPANHMIIYKNEIAPVIDEVMPYLHMSDHKEVLNYIYNKMGQKKSFNKAYAISKLQNKYPTYWTDKSPSIIASVIEFPEYFSLFMKTLAEIQRDSRATNNTVEPPVDDIQAIIQPLIDKRNDHSKDGIRTYGLVYAEMGSKASWSQLMRRTHCRTKKEVVKARADKMELFKKTVDAMLNNTL